MTTPLTNTAIETTLLSGKSGIGIFIEKLDVILQSWETKTQTRQDPREINLQGDVLEAFNRLRTLGIPSSLILDSEVSQDAYQSLYKSLRTMTSLDRSKWLQEPWQLQVLSGETRFYEEILANHFKAGAPNWSRDGSNRYLFHYAAWSGRPEALDWVMQHDPEPLYDRQGSHGQSVDMYDTTIAETISEYACGICQWSCHL